MRRHGLVALVVVAALAAGCTGDPTTRGADPTGADPVPSASTQTPSTPAPSSASATASATASAPAASATSATAPAETPSTAPTPADPPALEPSTECVVPARLAGQDVERLAVDDRLVALTFDAGANADGVASILATLLEREVPATFFLTGTFVQAFRMRSARIARRHLVGNHSMDHLDLTTVTDLRIQRQVRRAEAAILETTGEDPRRFFRFPFGARDAHTVAVVNDLCYVPFRWTVDTLGWKGTTGGMTADEVLQRVLDAAVPGAIVLMHVGANPDDGSTLDADALPRIIRRLRLRGYEFVQLSRVLAAVP